MEPMNPQTRIGERRSNISSSAWLGYPEAAPRFHEREALGEYLEPMHYRVWVVSSHRLEAACG